MADSQVIPPKSPPKPRYESVRDLKKLTAGDNVGGDVVDGQPQAKEGEGELDFGETSMENPNSFAEHLAHKFALVNAQAEAGLHNIRKSCAFLTRVANIYKTFGTDLRSLSDGEKKAAQMDKTHADAMYNFFAATNHVPEVLRQLAQRALTFDEKTREICALLNDYANKGEVKRKLLEQKENKEVNAMEELRKNVTDAHHECRDIYENMLVEKKNKEEAEALGPNGKKQAEKQQAKFMKLHKKASEKYPKFEELRVKSDQQMKIFHTTTLPNLMRDAQIMEAERLSVVRRAWLLYLKAHRELMAPLTQFQQLNAMVEALNVSDEIQACVANWVSIYGEPPAPFPLPLDLPCKSEDLVSDSWSVPGKGRNTGPLQDWIAKQYPAGAAKALEESKRMALINTSSETDAHSPSGISHDDSMAESKSDEKQNSHHAHKTSLLVGDLVVPSEGPISDGVTARALYDWTYEPCGDEANDSLDYISFKAGDLVEVTSQEYEWWEGELNGHSGYFPSNLVEIITIKKTRRDEEAPTPRSHSTVRPNQGMRTTVVADAREEKPQNSLLANVIRGKVSKKKRRFQQDGFDLDLSYVTPYIITMGFPSEALSAVYRNNMSEVRRFLQSRHGAKYKVYNLCSERAYDPAKFDGRVARYGFADHNPSPFEMILPFCQDVEKWLSGDPENIAAVHCKAGKGRTGLFIACFLLYSKQFSSATEALRYFGEKRTYNAKGVTIPSQIRYVYYFERWLKEHDKIPTQNPLNIKQITLITIPQAVKAQATNVWFEITTNDVEYSSKNKVKAVRYIKEGLRAHNTIVFGPKSMEGIPTVDEDVKIQFFHSTAFGKNKMFQLWFNTRFLVASADANVTILNLPKKELDKAVKDKKGKNYDENFAVEIEFSKTPLTT